MMRSYIKYFVAAAATAAVAILFYLSCAAWGNLITAKDHVMFYLEQPVSIRKAAEIAQGIQQEWENAGQEENGGEMMPEFCIWGQKENIQLTNQNLLRYANADAILLCGNPEFLYDDCRQPDREDTEGCLVDEGTAWELFGSLDVTGKEISYDGTSYIIRKVLPGDKKIFAYQVNGRKKAETGNESAEDTSLNRITVKKPEGKTVQEIYSMWNIRYDMSLQIMDLELLRGIGGFCVLLLPLSACICFLCYLLGQLREQKKIPLKAVIAVLIALSLLCFGILLKNQIRIPDSYIPTRWSDFSFWSDLWKEKKDALNLLIRMPKTNLDAGWMSDFVRSAGFGAVAELFLLLFIFYCYKMRVTSKKAGEAWYSKRYEEAKTYDRRTD